VDEIIKTGLSWDVMGGVARRSWARNEHALETAINWNLIHKDHGHITLPFIAEEGLVESLVAELF